VGRVITHERDRGQKLVRTRRCGVLAVVVCGAWVWWWLLVDGAVLVFEQVVATRALKTPNNGRPPPFTDDHC
jgi:hypothetical protein